MRRRNFLAAMAGLAVVGCRVAPPVAAPRGDGGAAARALMEDMVARGLMPGAQAVVLRGGETVLELVVGHDRPSDGRAVTMDDVYNVGSVTKPITALLLMKLVEEGALSLDTRVHAVLPRYPWKDDTVLGLMLHTAGHDFTQFVAWPVDAAGMEAFRSAVYTPRPHAFTPDSTYSYWSTGYFVLLEVIEAVAGTDYESFARRQLFDPLGMAASTNDWRRVPAGRRILPWDATAGDFQATHAQTPPLGETGLLTTARDLAAVGRMLAARGAGLYRPETIATALGECTGGRFDKSPAFWLKGPVNRHGCFGALQSPATAGHPGYTGSMLSFDPASDTTVVVVSNGMALQGDFGNYGRLADALLAAVG
jgi:CubicO group peptidase (beta-lactamase class C family)